MTTQLRNIASSVVAVVEPDTTGLVVAQVMRRDHVGALVVVDAGDKNRPVGIVTDRDLVLELMAEGLDPAVFTAGDIMSVDLVTATLDMDAADAVQLMNAHQLRRLVLGDEPGRLVGIVTMEDVLGLLARALDSLSRGLAGAKDREARQRRCAVAPTWPGWRVDKVRKCL